MPVNLSFTSLEQRIQVAFDPDGPQTARRRVSLHLQRAEALSAAGREAAAAWERQEAGRLAAHLSVAQYPRVARL